MLPEASVADAVIALPRSTLRAGLKAKVALPSEPVVTFSWPMNLLPSSVPQGLEKNLTTCREAALEAARPSRAGPSRRREVLLVVFSRLAGFDPDLDAPGLLRRGGAPSDGDL